MENLPPILVVDDEAHIRLTLSETLKAAGYQTDVAANGNEALSCIEAQEFSLVLLDLRMPGKDGMEVLAELSRSRPDIPVIVVTAHGNVQTALEAVESGAAGFIEKPFTPERIRDTVAHALDRKRQESEATWSYEEHLEHAVNSLHERQLNAATEHVRKALALDVTRPEAFNLMGVLLQLRGHLQDARQYYQSALAVNPGYIPAQKNRENLSNPPHERKLSVYYLE